MKSSDDCNRHYSAERTERFGPNTQFDGSYNTPGHRSRRDQQPGRASRG